MNLWEFMTIAVKNIRSNKMRSFLTTLGILIGTAGVITVVAVGQGGRAVLIQQMEDFGTNIFVISPQDDSDTPGSLKYISSSDLNVLSQTIPEVTHLAPSYRLYGNLRGPRGQLGFMIMGTNSEYAKIVTIKINKGRFIAKSDDQKSKGLIVLTKDTAEKLFGEDNPLGQQVMLENYPTRVVGVVSKNDSVMGVLDGGEKAYVPLSFMYKINHFTRVDNVYASAASQQQTDNAMQKCIRVLERRHSGIQHYQAQSMQQAINTAEETTRAIELFIGIITGVSLLVGGIGVMNIMLVAVSERTREIGIRMALGAGRREIIIQFIVEAVLLCWLGGMVGTALGYSQAWLIARLANWPPLVSPATAALACGSSMAIGLFFGVYPANQASLLDPIEALRRD